MKDDVQINRKENISYKEFLQGVPDNIHYEYNYLKGLDDEEMRQEVRCILIGLASVVVGAVAILLPVLLQ
jgi:hypothetical protein